VEGVFAVFGQSVLTVLACLRARAMRQPVGGCLMLWVALVGAD